MQKIKGRVFIFSASAIVGLLISINFGMLGNNDVFKLDSIEYKDAIEIRNTLYRDIENLQDQYNETNTKINIYDYHDYDHEDVVLDMRNQLDDYSYIAGTNHVKGTGIIIKIEDGDYDIYEDQSYEIDRKTLHDIDLAMVLNELRHIGAEAIAVNNYRILNNTGVECDWAFVIFNQNEASRQAQPFYFYAIGNPEELETALLSEGSYLNKLIVRGLQVEIEKEEELIILSTTNDLNVDYMERIN